jgi:hypothetical protein
MQAGERRLGNAGLTNNRPGLEKDTEHSTQSKCPDCDARAPILRLLVRSYADSNSEDCNNGHRSPALRYPNLKPYLANYYFANCGIHSELYNKLEDMRGGLGDLFEAWKRIDRTHISTLFPQPVGDPNVTQWPNHSNLPPPDTDYNTWLTHYFSMAGLPCEPKYVDGSRIGGPILSGDLNHHRYWTQYSKAYPLLQLIPPLIPQPQRSCHGLSTHLVATLAKMYHYIYQENPIVVADAVDGADPAAGAPGNNAAAAAAQARDAVADVIAAADNEDEDDDDGDDDESRNGDSAQSSDGLRPPSACFLCTCYDATSQTENCATISKSSRALDTGDGNKPCQTPVSVPI